MKKSALTLFITAIICLSAFAGITMNDPLFRENAVVDYLMIVPDDPGILEEAARLATKKWEKGLKTRIVVMDSIENHMPGKDTPEKIRNLIKHAYAEWQVTWVLLIGDYNLLPARLIGESQYNLMYSDIYFACLDGQWDYDNDGVYGNETGSIEYHLDCYTDEFGNYTCNQVSTTGDSLDLWHDIYLGRLPASNQAEAAIMPQNSIRTNRLLFLGEHANFRPYSRVDLLDIADGTYYWHRNLKPIYDSSGSAFQHFGFDEVYEDSICPDGSVIADTIYRSPETYQDMLSLGNNIVYYLGHGGEGSWETCSFREPKPYLVIDHVKQLSSPTYSNIITLSCKTMAFHNGKAIGKEFLINPNGGAVSYVGSTHFDMTSRTVKVYQDMARLLAFENVHRISRAFELAHAMNNTEAVNKNIYSRHCYFTHQFWGDPELEVWTKPVTDQDRFKIGVMDMGSGKVRIQIQPGLDSVLVCMYKANALFVRGYTKNGSIEFRNIPQGIAGITITASKHNFVPSSVVIDRDNISREQAPAVDPADALTVFPNPFNAAAHIKLGSFKNAHIFIYNINGLLVQTYRDYKAGLLKWNAKNLPSGVYIVKVRAGKRTLSKSVVLQR
jgi:hypothetical protein